MSHQIKRRDFLKVAGVSAVAASGLPAFFPAPAFAQNQNVNSKLQIACIGIAARGSANVSGVSEERIVALCDVDKNYLAQGKTHFPDAKTYQDFRKMFNEIEDDIDAIVVSTPDHTHAVAAMTGMKLGKHCYCEKPLAHNVKEVRQMMAIARDKKLVTQMGTQIHAEPNYRRVVELIRANAIGAVKEVHVWCGTSWGGREILTDTPPVPENLDWDLWIGPAKMRPYHPQYFGQAWRCWWDFGNGTVGDMACHHLDLSFWALDLTLPRTIEAFCEEKPHPEMAPKALHVKYEFAALRNKRPAVTLHWYDGKLKPEIIKERNLPDNWGAGTIFVGDKGLLMSDYSRHLLFPEDKYKDYQPPKPSIPDSIGHHHEWVNACIDNKPNDPLCRFSYSGPLAETVLLGSVAFRTGKKLEWDSRNMKATNCPEADQYLSREYRPGWEF